MTLPIQYLAPDFATAPQMHPDQMRELAASGFRSVVNNRPDFEGGPDQPEDRALREAALAANLEYVFLPVSPNYFTPEQVAKFAELLARLPKPVLAFCRSGTRSGKLYRAALAQPDR